MPTPTPYRSRLARFASFVALHLLVVGAGIVAVSSGCSRRESADGAEQEDGGQTAVRAFDASRRKRRRCEAFADAARGSRALRDRRRRALLRGEGPTGLSPSALDETERHHDARVRRDHDARGGFRPDCPARPRPSWVRAYDFPNWDSIAKDGATAARIGQPHCRQGGVPRLPFAVPAQLPRRPFAASRCPLFRGTATHEHPRRALAGAERGGAHPPGRARACQVASAEAGASRWKVHAASPARPAPQRARGVIPPGCPSPRSPCSST